MKQDDISAGSMSMGNLEWRYHAENNRSCWGLGIIRTPDIFQKLAPHLLHCKHFHEKIREQFTTIINSGVFDIEWVEYHFNKNGFGVSVPGDRTWVAFAQGPDSCYDHNVDTATQCLSLYVFMSTLIAEAWGTFAVWEKSDIQNLPGIDLNDNRDYINYHIDRNPDTAPFELLELKDDREDTGIRLYARGRRAAIEIANKNGIDSNDIWPVPFFETEKILTRCRKFKVEVLSDETHLGVFEVIANSSSQAEDLVEDSFVNQPGLFKPTSIKCLEKNGELLSPQILNRTR